MKYTIDFELPDNETVLKEIKTNRVNWSIWGYNGQAKAKPILKEQEPVCVYEAKINKCVCGNIVNRYYHPKFCGYCGKELIWY